MTRVLYVTAIIVLIILGLASRRYSQYLPQFVADYAGDTLWALTAFFGVRAVFPRWKILTAALAALLFSFSIEISQLYHSPWTDDLRRTLIGGLVLGYGFLWTDLFCYSVGVGAGAVMDFLVFKRSENENNRLSDN
jgi:hypothetical protein